MADLRELLYEPWMETDASHNQFERRAALATRMPEAVPVGLEWDGVRWLLHPDGDPSPITTTITEGQAELMFIGNAVEVLADLLRDRNLPMPTTLITQVAALHRLADERDAAKETT